VELRQHRQDDIVVVQGQRLGERQVVPEAVGVRQHDALRGGFAARREDHQQRIVVVHRSRRSRPERDGYGRFDSRRSEHRDLQHPFTAAVRAGVDGPDRLAGESRVLVLDEHERRRRPREDVGQLACGQPPRQRHERNARQRAREERHDVIGRVARHRRDAVARRIAGSAQSFRKRRRSRRERSVVGRDATVVHRGPLR
jgi:hypothetical protein